MIVDKKKAKKILNPLYLAIWAVSAVYFVGIIISNTEWSFLDNVNLPIHEAGHAIFMVFGNDFITIAGGTIMELLVPLVFVIYFYATCQKFSASLVMLWLGEAMISVSVYMGDAVDMALPLITGDSSSHDWHNMFSMFGLLPLTHFLADMTRWMGIVIILYGIIRGLKYCRKEETLPLSY